MKQLVGFVILFAAAGSLFIMGTVMYRYAEELEAEREFILESSKTIRSAFDQFETISAKVLAHVEENKSHSVLISVPKSFRSVERYDIDPMKPRFSNTRNRQPEISPQVSSWTKRFLGPVLCEQQHHRGIFHLHMRKAAGTTVRNYLESVASKSNSRYIESEGISISAEFTALDGTTTVVSIRDPIDRVFSMYWYEHVAWWNEIKKDMSKCSTMKDWIEAWRDGSTWKTDFIKKNPSNTYVEIENYYVKTLSGWKGPYKVTIQDLDADKRALGQFDIVIIADWLKNDTQKRLLKSVFKSGIHSSHTENQGNQNARIQLKPRLLPDSVEAQLTKVIRDLNELDLELWDYAKTLVRNRLRMFESLTEFMKHERNDVVADLAKKFMLESEFSCFKVPENFNQPKPIPRYLASQIGLFRPPLHKGPI